jgi:hypothetical protein
VSAGIWQNEPILRDKVERLSFGRTNPISETRASIGTNAIREMKAGVAILAERTQSVRGRVLEF